MLACGAQGSIIHVMSTAAHFGEADGASYCAAKAGLLNFARSAAMDLAHHGIRVNTITPCSMEHQLWTTMRDEMFDPDWVQPERRGFYSRQEYLDQLPLRRFPRAADLAWAAVFLASDESSCMTGSDMAVDAGLLDVMLTWDQTGSFEVGELNADSQSGSDDWMSKLLQMMEESMMPVLQY
jgi:NAD(P)-dependent dehydrogenase (short-subunit alcohol dehydrogenase family)